jgi:hypothetical protein
MLMPRGRRPSTAALTRLGARKASDMIMLTCRRGRKTDLAEFMISAELVPQFVRAVTTVEFALSEEWRTQFLCNTPNRLVHRDFR